MAAEESLEQRVAGQFSGLYLTLVSVMTGLVLADLLSQVHDRMTLWPLSWMTLRTWLQIAATMAAVLSSWVSYTHLGMLRRRLPTIWDTLDASLVLITVPLNAFAGRVDATGWFVCAAAYCVLGLSAIWINVTQSAREPILRDFCRLIRFGGPYTYLFLGVPGFTVTAVLAHTGFAPLWLQCLAVASAPAAGVWVTIHFMREWRQLVQSASVSA
jgi:cation transporter-like permease